MSLSKLKQYKIAKRGLRGCVVTLPQIWLIDQHLKKGDLLVMFRDTKTDDLVVRKGNPVA